MTDLLLGQGSVLLIDDIGNIFIAVFPIPLKRIISTTKDDVKLHHVVASGSMTKGGAILSSSGNAQPASAAATIEGSAFLRRSSREPALAGGRTV